MVDTPLSTYPDRVLTDLLGHDSLNRVGKLDVSALRPSGPDTSLQFSDGGVLGGDSGLTWAKTTNIMNFASSGGFGWNDYTRFIGKTDVGALSVNGSVSLGSPTGPFGIGSAATPDYAIFQIAQSTPGNDTPYIHLMFNASNSNGVWLRTSSTNDEDPFVKQNQVAANSDVLYWDMVAAHEETSGFWSWNGIGLIRYSVDGTPSFSSLPSRFRLYVNSGKDGYDTRMDLRADGTNMFSSVITSGATQNSLTPIMVLQKRTDGTPGVGTGIDLRFNVDTAAGNTETGANIQVVTTDITAASEDFDIVFKTMAAGASAERARLTSGSEFKLTHSIGSYGTLGWFSGPGGPEIALSSGGKISFHPQGVETLRLTDLGSGKGAGVSIGDGHESFQLAGSFARLAIFSDYNATTNMHIHLAGKDRHGPWIQTTANGHATSYTTKDFMQDGDYVFALTMLSATTASFEGAASMECKVDGTPALNIMPCKLVFNVNSGHAGYEERFVMPALGVNKLGFNSWTNTNQVHNALKLWHLTHNTPAVGIGTSLSFETTTNHSPTPYNQEVGGVIESVTTDITAASEDFDMVFKTMAGGATAAERLRVNNVGILVPASAYANWGTTQGSSGYGIRDNAGTIEVKNSGGSWAAPGGASLPLIGTGATITASAPLLDLSQTWNNSGVSFTGMKLNVTNTASASISSTFGSMLMDLQVGGNSIFSVSKEGVVSGGNKAGGFCSTDNGVVYYGAFSNSWVGGSPNAYVGIGAIGSYAGLYLRSDIYLGFVASNNINANPDTAWTRGNAAGVMGLINGLSLSSPTSLYVYNTVDNPASPTNYERAVFDWSTASNTLTIATQAGGTGSNRNIYIDTAGGAGEIHLNPSGSNRKMVFNASFAQLYQGLFITSSAGTYSFYSSTTVGGYGDVGIKRVTTSVIEVNDSLTLGTVGYIRLSGVAVSALPAASATYKGCRGTVTDANATTFLSTVAGGGSNVVPVFCDGSAWKIG